MDALLIVDVQNDFLPGGALAVPHGDEVVSLANRLSPLFELTIATQDWHPPDHASFAASHPGRRIGDVIDLHGLPQVLWPIHCVQGTPGAELAPALDRSHITSVIQKGTDRDVDSYSGFFDNDRRRATGLDGLLRKRGVRRVYVMGLATDYCVKYTVLDALSLGYAASLIADASRPVNLQPGDGERAIDEMRAAGAAILNSLEVIRLRQKKRPN